MEEGGAYCSVIVLYPESFCERIQVCRKAGSATPPGLIAVGAAIAAESVAETRKCLFGFLLVVLSDVSSSMCLYVSKLTVCALRTTHQLYTHTHTEAFYGKRDGSKLDSDGLWILLSFQEFEWLLLTPRQSWFDKNLMWNFGPHRLLPSSLSPLNPPPLFPGTPNKATCAEIRGLTFSAVSLLIAMQWENGRGGKKRKASLSFPYVTSFCYFSSFTPSFFPHLYLPLCWRFLFTCSPLCNSVGAARLRTFAPHGRDAFFIHPWPQLLRFTDRQYRT